MVLDLTAEANNFLKYLEFSKTCSPHTLIAYKNDLLQAFYPEKNTQPELGSIPAATNTPAPANQQKLEAHLELALEDGQLLNLARQAQLRWSELQPASRHRKTAVLKSFFRYLFENEKLTQDLSLQLHSPKVPNKIPRFLAVDEALSILSYLKTTDVNIEKKILFFLLYGGGLRISEACQLKWSHVNFNKSAVTVLGKGGRERMVAVPELVIRQLEIFYSQSPTGLVQPKVFTDLTPSQGYQWIRELGHAAGLQRPLNPHALRHSFATHLLESGADLRAIQELLGHQSLVTTQKYTHLSLHQLANTMNAKHPLQKSLLKKT